MTLLKKKGIYISEILTYFCPWASNKFTTAPFGLNTTLIWICVDFTSETDACAASTSFVSMVLWGRNFSKLKLN